jgi:hypothetical protein
MSGAEGASPAATTTRARLGAGHPRALWVLPEPGRHARRLLGLLYLELGLVNIFWAWYDAIVWQGVFGVALVGVAIRLR